MDERDCVEMTGTPAGTAKVITLHNRHDFETFVRCMMAGGRFSRSRELPEDSFERIMNRRER